MHLPKFWEKGKNKLILKLHGENANVLIFKRFHELSDLVAHFKDCAGADDMASPSSLDFEDDFPENEEKQQPLQPPPSSKRSAIASLTASGKY